MTVWRSELYSAPQHELQDGTVQAAAKSFITDFHIRVK